METLTMSGRERRRLEMLSRVKRKELTLAAASRVLGLSYRQAKRIWARYQAEGDRGWCIGCGASRRTGGRTSARPRRWRCVRRVMPTSDQRWRQSSWQPSTA